ncbi:MAG TPA: ABC transporter ATP-binding protein [Gemmatimonadaceae bacterium]|nr:ABC transporter ATP-binding protein [Gemmatimonadaceae bacterium]
MIEVRNVSKTFGKLKVLNDLSLSVASRRVTGLIGPNAAGKTTLAKIILGLATADRGTVEVGGVSVLASEQYRQRIGYMPQLARFPENLCARELFAMLSDLRQAKDLDQELLERFDFKSELNKPVRTLSGGTRQKLNAMIAFLFRPELLILDEPTAGLDPVSSGVLKDKILREKSFGKTFLLTSHIMSELEELADDVAFINEGRVAFAGPLAELKRVTRQTNLERAIAEMMKRGAAA